MEQSGFCGIIAANKMKIKPTVWRIRSQNRFYSELARCFAKSGLNTVENPH